MEPVPDMGETGFIVQCGQGFSLLCWNEIGPTLRPVANIYYANVFL